MKLPLRLLGGGLFAIALVAIALGPANGWIRQQLGSHSPSEPLAQARAQIATVPEPVLTPGDHDSIEISATAATAMRIESAPATRPTRPRTLTLMGSLALDTNYLAHVHARFPGEVVELGTTSTSDQNAGATPYRPVEFGDHVQKGQILAVLWSSELGEKKSEYIDALSKLELARQTLQRNEKLFEAQAIPERVLHEVRFAFDNSQIAVARIERTLRAWRLAEPEIESLRHEAARLRDHPGSAEKTLEAAWARVELRSPLDGSILEKNLAVGDIVDTTLDLFKVADLRRLRVWAYVYEEDLATLLDLPSPIRWTVRLQSNPAAPALEGTVDKIGDMIDPTQHTAPVFGRILNPDERLRAGQFITATIEIPPNASEVEVPISAIIDDGDESSLFVQPTPSQPVYSMRGIKLLRRAGDLAIVQSRQNANDRQGVALGELVVTSGGAELKAALNRLKAAVKAKSSSLN
jgi:cobalt-zinc-cadmium efflux system membrane fusion protein